MKMARVEVCTEAGYYEGESNLPYELCIYDATTYADLDSQIEEQIKAAGGQVIIVKLVERY